MLLSGLLGDCVVTIEALLASPKLNLDELEQATQDAIEVARETLQAVKTALNESARGAEYLMTFPAIRVGSQRTGCKQHQRSLRQNSCLGEPACSRCCGSRLRAFSPQILG